MKPEELERVLREAGRWPELAELYEKMAAKAPDLAHSALLLEQAARLFEQKAGDPTRAEGCRRRALEFDPNLKDAFRALSARYEKREEFAKLADLLAQQAVVQEDRIARSELFLRLGKLEEERLGRPLRALIEYRRAWVVYPENVSALASAKLVAERLGLPRVLYRLLVRQMGLGIDRQNLAAAFLELASDLEQNDPLAGELVGACRDRALEADPESSEASAAIAEAHKQRLRAGKNWKKSFKKELAEARKSAPNKARQSAQAALSLALAADDEGQREAIEACEELLRRSAGDEMALTAMSGLLSPSEYLVRLWDQLGATRRKGRKLELCLELLPLVREADAGTERFEDLLRRALDVDPMANAPLVLLREHLETEGDFEAVAEILEGRLERLDEDGDRLIVWTQLARLYQSRLDEPVKAAASWERVLAMRPESGEAAEALLRIQRERGDPEALAHAMELTFDLVPDNARAARLREIAELREKQGEPHMAFVAWCRAFREDSGADEAVDGLERTVEAAESWDELASMYQDELNKVAVERSTRFALRAGEIWRDKVGDHQAAISCLEHVLLADPARFPDERLSACRLMAEIHEASGDWQGTAASLTRALEVPAGEHGLTLSDKRGLLVRLGRAKRLASDHAGAGAALRRALDIDSTDTQALDELTQVLEEDGDLPGLVSVLERQIENASGAELARARCRLARVKADQMGDLGGALELLRSALDEAPDEAEAQEVLEALRERGGEAADEAARLLGELYEQRGEWRKLVDLLEAELARLEEPAARGAVLGRIATLQEERLDQLDMAFITWCRALRESPEDTGPYDALWRLADQVEEGWSEVIALCEEVADSTREPAASGMAALKAAEVMEQKLGRPGEAVDLYRRSFKLTAGHDEALAAGALDALERIAAAADDARGQARSLALRVEFGVGLQDDVERAAALRRLARLRVDKLGDPEGALEALEEARSLAPDDPDSAATYERLLSETGAYERLVEVLLERLEQVSDGAARAGVRCRVAELMSKRLERTEDAADQLSMALEEQPDREEAVAGLEELLGDQHARPLAATALAPHYRSTEQWSKLAEVREVEIEELTREDQKIPVFTELCDLYQQRLERADLAFLTACRWNADFPGDEDARQRLEGLAAVTGSWEEAVGALEDEIEKSPDPVSAARTRIRVASLHLERLERPDRAISHLRAVLEETNEALGALRVRAAEMLAGLFREQKNWGDLAEVLETRLAVLESPAARAEALRELAQLYLEELDDPETAFRASCRAVRADPSSRVSIENAETLAAAGERWDELSALYEDLAEDADTPAIAAAYLRRVGEILERKLGKKERARLAYRLALEKRPEDRTALHALGRLAEQVGDWEEVVELLEREAACTEDDAELLRVRLRLARVLEEQLDDSDRAAEQYKHVVRTNPRHVEALEALDRLFERRGGEPAARLGVLQLRIRVVPEEQRVDLLKRMARIALDEIERPGDAIRYLTSAQEADPGNTEIKDMLGQAYEASGDVDSLAKLYTQRASEAAGDERTRWLRRVALLLEEQGEDPVGVRKAWEALLSVEPEDPQALASLAGYHREDGDWEALADTLRRQIPLQHDSVEAKALFFELASVLAEQLAAPADAVEAASRAMEIEPFAAGDLERAEEVFLRCNAWAEYSRLLERRASLAADPEEAAGVHKARAKLIQTKLRQPAAAAEAYRAALAAVPGDEEAKAALTEIYETTGSWEELAEMLVAELETRPERQRRNEILQQLSEFYENKLDRREQALRLYFRAFREDPADESVQRELERIAREAGKLAAMVEIYRDTAEALGDRGLAAKMFLKVAEICRREIESPEQAAEAYRMVLAHEPGNEEARKELITLLSELGRFEDLAEALRAQAEGAPSSEQRVRLLKEAAEVYDTRLNKPSEAAACLGGAVDLDPRDRDALEALVRVLGEEERWDEAVAALEKGAAAERRPEAARILKRRIADLLEQKVGDFDGAIALHRSFLEEKPADADALDALGKIYTKTGRWDDLLEVFARRAGATQDVATRASLYRQMASIADEEFGDSGRAARFLRRALELEPGDPSTLASLEAALRRSEEWEELVDVLQKRRQMTEESSSAAALCYERGEVLERRLFEIDEAAECYQEALELDPAFGPAGMALARIYRSLRDWPKCLEALEVQASQMGDTPETTDVFLQMGEICRSELEDDARAREYYGRALELDPSSEKAVEALKHLTRDLGDWTAYLSLLTREADLVVDPETKAKLYSEMGELWQSKLNDDGQAKGYYESALEAVPGYPAAALPLGDLAFEAEDWDEAETHLSSVVARSYRGGESAAPNELLYRLGFVAEKLGRETLAFQRYKEAYELDAIHLPTLDGLARLAHLRGEHDLALKVLKTILFHHRDRKDRDQILEIYCRLGEIHLSRDESDQATRMFEKALTVDGNCVPALERLAVICEESGEGGRAQAFRLRLKAAQRKKE